MDVAFFLILANIDAGLKTTDHNLSDLFTIYKANRWQRRSVCNCPWRCRFFGGLKIAVVWRSLARSVEYGGHRRHTGLAFRILEASTVCRSCACSQR